MHKLAIATLHAIRLSSLARATQSHLRIESGKTCYTKSVFTLQIRRVSCGCGSDYEYHYHDQKNAIKADVYQLRLGTS